MLGTENKFFVVVGFGYVAGGGVTDAVMDAMGLNTRLLAKTGWQVGGGGAMAVSQY